MRHLNRGRRLGRNASHRKAMFRNMVAALFRHGRIITTPAKAKEARPFAERLITLAKRGSADLGARRRAIQLLHDPALVRSLFDDIGLRYQERAGGYTRILHLAKTRVGDGARQVLFELVEGGVPVGKAAGKDRAKAPKAAVVTEPAAAAAAAPAASESAVTESEVTATATEDAPADEKKD